MSLKKYLDTAPLYDIERYDSHIDLEKEAVSFVGAPRKHPYDDEKLLLVLDPFSSNTMFYEFQVNDICYVEDVASIGTESGQNLPMVKIWIKKGSLGLQYQPFEVDRPLRFFKDSEILQQALSESN